MGGATDAVRATPRLAAARGRHRLALSWWKPGIITPVVGRHWAPLQHAGGDQTGRGDRRAEPGLAAAVLGRTPHLPPDQPAGFGARVQHRQGFPGGAGEDCEPLELGQRAAGWQRVPAGAERDRGQRCPAPAGPGCHRSPARVRAEGCVSTGRWWIACPWWRWKI